MRRKAKRRVALVAAAVAAVVALAGARGCRSATIAIVEEKDGVLVTGYCNCGKCCGWKRSWFGFGSPVYTYGRMKGKPKEVGITATGSKAKHGTIAADPKVFPFGTRLAVPGYGVGTVEDVGGAIKGRHIDIWFPSHEKARQWGTRRLNVEVVK